MKKDKLRKGIRTIIILGLLVVGAWLFLHHGMHLGTWRGNSFESYQKNAYHSYDLKELPEGAESFRFKSSKLGLAAYSMAAFTLHGSQYDDFVSSIEREKSRNARDDRGFVSKKVSETYQEYDDYGDYVGFPKTNFRYVIDDEISDYVILYYDAYRGAGETIQAIIAKPETGRIVIYNYASN